MQEVGDYLSATARRHYARGFNSGFWVGFWAAGVVGVFCVVVVAIWPQIKELLS